MVLPVGLTPLSVVSAAACSPPPWSSSNPASDDGDTRGETCDSAERVAASAVVREGMRVREAARGARGERVAGNGHRAPFEIEVCQVASFRFTCWDNAGGGF